MTANLRHLRVYGMRAKMVVVSVTEKYKLKVEIRLQILSKLRNYKSKMDEITESIFGALEGMK
jgi:hypothetical protein